MNMKKIIITNLKIIKHRKLLIFLIIIKPIILDFIGFSFKNPIL